MFCCESFPRFARSRLDEVWRPLFGRLDQVRPSHLEVLSSNALGNSVSTALDDHLPFMVYASNMIRVNILLGCIVSDDRIIPPRSFPQFVSHLKELVCFRITFLVRDLLLQSEISSCTFEVASDDIP